MLGLHDKDKGKKAGAAATTSATGPLNDTVPPNPPTLAPTQSPTPTSTSVSVVPKPTGPAATTPTVSPPATTSPATTKPAVPAQRVFTQRALLVGVKNYYYLNPLNPGYESRLKSPTNDPLGFQTLRDRLTRYMNFEDSHIAELSDVAARDPYPPLKACIQDTIVEFLNTSRPQDSILLLFAGHAVVIGDKAYLAPVEAELPKADEFIPLSWLYEQLAQCKARHKLLILDVAWLDPEEGVSRAGGGPLDAKVEEELKAPPPGVLVWVSCATGQQSYTWSSSGITGSAFLHFMGQLCELRRGSQIMSEYMKQPPPAEWDLPLLRMANLINKEVADYAKVRAGLAQTPRLYGVLGSGPDPQQGDKALAAAIKLAPLPDVRVEDHVVDAIFQELYLGNDRGRQMRASSLPPFWSKDMEPYLPDYSNPEEFKQKLAESEFRRVTVEVAQALSKYDTTFRMGFRFTGDEQRFKQMIEREQERPAQIFEELSILNDKLKKVEKLRDKETPRWRANYDYVVTRVLAKMAFTLEYNYMIGSKFRKDAPMIENPRNNGWKLVPSERLQQKETRDYQRQRDKILDRMLTEHKKTPWELLAKREKSATLGLQVQEARVD